MNLDKLKQGYEKCKYEKRYQIVDTKIFSEYFKSSEEDLHKAQKELIGGNLYWSIAALDSAVSQAIYALSIKEKGLRPKSRICAENLVCSEYLINKSEYELIQKIRETRNKVMYDALFRKDLNKKEIGRLISDFENFLLKKEGKND